MEPLTGVAALGSSIFVLVWVLLLKDEWKWLPLGRPLSAVLGAVLMVACGVLSPDEAYRAVNMETLVLLLGCMVVSAHMEKQGLYDRLSTMLSREGGSPRDFLFRVSAAAAVSSAVVTNDAACILLTPLVISACQQRRFHPAPHLMGLATCANIGSACSPIGNPQNMLIASLSRLSFVQFLGHVGLASVAGTLANIAIITWVYKSELSTSASYDFPASDRRGKRNPELSVSASATQPSAGNGDCEASRLTASLGHEASHSDAQAAAWHERVCVAPEGPESKTPTSTVKNDELSFKGASHALPDAQGPSTVSPLRALPVPGLWRSRTISALLVAFPVVLLCADRWIGLGWLTLLYAVLLCVIDGDPPQPIMERVDANLLLFFSGLFVSVAGFNATGVPGAVWASVAEASAVRTVSGTAVFTGITVLGSNVVSNVPLVLLMGPKVSELPPSDATLAWSLLAWVSTVAGNATLLGSVANLIVAAKARGAYELSFREYLRVGLPSTALMCVAGVPLVWGLTSALS